TATVRPSPRRKSKSCSCSGPPPGSTRCTTPPRRERTTSPASCSESQGRNPTCSAYDDDSLRGALAIGRLSHIPFLSREARRRVDAPPVVPVAIENVEIHDFAFLLKQFGVVL